VRYHVVDRPKYMHGGYAPRPLPRDVEVVHMQNWLEPLRSSPGAQASLLRAVVSTREAGARASERSERNERFAVYVPVHPAHAELLEMNLDRAAELGVLAKTDTFLVVEDEAEPARRSERVRELCRRYGVEHRFTDTRIGYYTPGETRMLVHCLAELAERAPEAAWLFRVDADLLLVGDAWTHLAKKAAASDADICANVRDDARFDPDGFIVVPCSAFSRATCRALSTLVASRDWPFIEARLEGVSDVDVTFAARLLDLCIVAPDGRDGYRSVRDLDDPDDDDVWRSATAGGALALHIAGPADKAGRMRKALARLRREAGSR